MENGKSQLQEVQENGQGHLQKMKMAVKEVEDKMIHNVEILVERGDNLEDVQKKTGELLEECKRFKKTGQALECTYWWKNIKLIAVIVVVVLIIILIIVLLATGVIPVSSATPPIVPLPTSKP